MLQMTDAMGLQGMINDLVQSDFPTGDKTNELDQLELKSNGSRQNHISAAENFPMLRQNFGGYPKRIKTAQFQY
jgi:hypothetical protein